MTYRYPVYLTFLLVCLLAGLTACWLGSEKYNGTVVFIENKKGPVGGEGTNEKEPPSCFGEGTGWGDPPPPSLDRPSGFARIGVYKSREATGRHS